MIGRGWEVTARDREMIGRGRDGPAKDRGMIGWTCQKTYGNLSSNGRKPSVETVDNHLKMFEKIYYQVAVTILDKQTGDRELRPLQAINDNYPKFILTMDQPAIDDYSGIRVQNILDFLLE